MVRLGLQTPKLGHPTAGPRGRPLALRPALALRRPCVRQHLVGAPLQMPLALCGVATGVHLGPSMLQSVCPCITCQWLDQNPSTVPEINYLQTYRHAHITAGTMDGCMCVRFCVHIHEENLSTESSESICSHCLVIVRWEHCLVIGICSHCLAIVRCVSRVLASDTESRCAPLGPPLGPPPFAPVRARSSLPIRGDAERAGGVRRRLSAPVESFTTSWSTTSARIAPSLAGGGGLANERGRARRAFARIEMRVTGAVVAAVATVVAALATVVAAVAATVEGAVAAAIEDTLAAGTPVLRVLSALDALMA